MNQQEYLRQLNEALTGYDMRIKEGVIRDFRQTIKRGLRLFPDEVTMIAAFPPVEKAIRDFSANCSIKRAKKAMPLTKVPVASKVSIIADKNIYVDMIITKSDNEQIAYRFTEHCSCFKFEGRSFLELRIKKSASETEFHVISHLKHGEDTVGFASGKLEIAIPKTVEIVKVRTYGGDIIVRNVQNKMLMLETMSGDIKLKNVIIRNLELGCAIGRVEMIGCECNIQISQHLETPLSNTLSSSFEEDLKEKLNRQLDAFDRRFDPDEAFDLDELRSNLRDLKSQIRIAIK